MRHDLVHPLVLGSLLVDVGLGLMRVLVKLVGDGILAGFGTGAERCVGVFGDV